MLLILCCITVLSPIIEMVLTHKAQHCVHFTSLTNLILIVIKASVSLTPLKMHHDSRPCEYPFWITHFITGDVSSDDLVLWDASTPAGRLMAMNFRNANILDTCNFKVCFTQMLHNFRSQIMKNLACLTISKDIICISYFWTCYFRDIRPGLYFLCFRFITALSPSAPFTKKCYHRLGFE